MRETVQYIASLIASDPVLAAVPGISVVVEDESDIAGELEKAMAGYGVMVAISVTGFTRRAQSGELLTGELTLAIDAIENSQLNRLAENPGYWTAQRVAVRLARILHWREIPASPGRLCLRSMTRADVRRESAIMRSVYAVEHDLAGTPETTTENRKDQ